MQKVDEMSTAMGKIRSLHNLPRYWYRIFFSLPLFLSLSPLAKDHHANMRIVHKCVNGVDLELEFFSFEANELTQKDHDAARAVDLIHNDNPIKISDYSYDLKQDSIALFPAETRGSSKLLRVNGSGKVSYFDHFGSSIPHLLRGCHIVFNNSRVLDARLSVDINGKHVELMVSEASHLQRMLMHDK